MTKRIFALLTLLVCLSVPLQGGEIPSTPAPPPPPPAPLVETDLGTELIVALLDFLV